MIETLTLITLSVLFLVFFRPGKTPPLDNPLIIQRPGQHHITLAPQLNLAQPLVEAISKEIRAQVQAQENCATQCFEVRDKQVTAHGQEFYLLAITRRNGMLYFQAIAPRPLVRDRDSHFNTLMEFAHAALANVPAPDTHNAEAGEQIAAATISAAQQHQIEIKRLLG
ncbi:MAG: hypothetical protein HY937_00155 [Nitrosomonadales bacterium]|nr:hypothetical protein [Nitrosomonadales bacterium]